MRTRPTILPFPVRRGVVLAACALAASALATFTGVAGAAPQPDIRHVQKMVNQLTTQMDQAVQQYDQAAQQVTEARQRLRAIGQQLSTAQARFASMRSEIAAIASTAYESGTMSSAGALLTSDNPQAVLSQASVLMQLSADRSAQVSEFISAARRLEDAQRMARRSEAGLAALEKQRLARKKAIGKTLGKQKTLLATLTAQQTATVGSGGSTTAVYTGPTATQAQKAVAFAYAQLGKPYQWGATGPGSYDCSGLMQAAWASAGVAIPRDTYSQVAGLPSVPLSSLQPGDLIFFDGDGHVAMYVGGGMIIDAPRTGLSVEKVSLSSSWYSSTVDSAARP